MCRKLSAAEQIKPDCCHAPAVVSILLTPLPVSCPTTPLHYSNTIEQLFSLFFPPFIFSSPGYLVTFLVPAPVPLIIFSITVATWTDGTVGADEQTTNFVMQDCLLITRILDFLNFICICTDTVVVLNYALFVYLCGI